MIESFLHDVTMQGKPKGVLHTQKYLHMMMRKSKLPLRTSSLQSNSFFHLGGFVLPFDGGIRNRFTCYFVKDTQFTGGNFFMSFILNVVFRGENIGSCGSVQTSLLHVQSLPQQQNFMHGNVKNIMFLQYPLIFMFQDVENHDLSSLQCIMPAGGVITSG